MLKSYYFAGCVAASLAPCYLTAQTPRPYDGNGPGLSTVGPGGTYENLEQALEMTTPLSGGDWVFEIIGDSNVTDFINYNVARGDGSRVIVRPAAGTTPTVTFLDQSNITLESQTPILIDGSNGSQDRALTITNTTAYSIDLGLFRINRTTGIEIRNCRIINNFRQSTGNISAVFYIFDFDGASNTSDVLVENCELRADQNSYAMGALLIRRIGIENTTTEGAEGIVFRNNDIYGGQRAFNLWGHKEVTIDGNRISIDQSSPNFSFIGVLFTTFEGQGYVTGSTFNFRNNIFNFSRTASNASVTSVNAILIDSLGDNTYNIENNFFGEIELTSNSGNITRYAPISVTRNTASIINVTHNSIDIPELRGALSSMETPAAVSIENPEFSGAVNLRNNVIRMAEESGAIIASNAPKAQYHASHNILSHTNGPIAEIAGVTYEVAADWNEEFGGGNIELDPYLPAENNRLGRWFLGEQRNNLRLVGPVPPEYLVPAVAGISVDIDGETRAGDLTIAGADVPIDSDGDGAPDQIEALAPQGDGNGDSIQDSGQPSVASIAGMDYTSIITLASENEREIKNAGSLPPPIPEELPIEATLPYGLLRYELRGVAETGQEPVEIYLSEAFSANLYLGYNFEEPNAELRWFDYRSQGIPIEVFGPLEIQYTDGDRGDFDGAVNRVIQSSLAPANRNLLNLSTGWLFE